MASSVVLSWRGDGQVGIDNLLHPRAQPLHILQGHGVTYPQITIISVGHGDVYHHSAVGIKVVYGFAEHEKQATGIGTGAGCRILNQIFHVFIVVQAIVQPLHLVIYFGTDGAILHFQI